MPTGIYKRTEYHKKMNASHGFKKGAVVWNKGKQMPTETKQKISATKKGRVTPLETRLKMSKTAKELVKSGKHNLWKGGITEINKTVRSSLEYRLWREAVFKRDNWTCIWCGKKGVRLNADHIKPFAYFPELRFAIDNGRTLCVDCHSKTDTYKNSYRKIHYAKII